MRNSILASSFLISGLLAGFTACNKTESPPATTTATPTAMAPAAPTVAPTAAATNEAKPELKTMTPAEVQKRLGEKNFFVFDDNGEERFKEGHVPGAKWVRASDLTAAVLPTDKSATLVFYCASTSCGACHEAADAAIKLGYTNVYIMPVGIKGWEEQKLPTEKVS